MAEAKKVKLETKLTEPGITFYDTKSDPFRAYGLYQYRDQPVCRRLPEDVAAATGIGVKHLSVETAGGRLRFSTDSEYIAISVKMPYVKRLSHMPLTGTTGFDLYLDSQGGSRYIKTFKPDPSITDGYESLVKLGDRRMRSYTLNFPSYNAVNELFIGIEPDAHLNVGEFYRTKLPVVFYGSSITQGACSSRPGLTYENIISRRYDLDYINLGFSGNGRAELPLVNYMASLDMLAFVSDYDHNAPSVDYLRETHRRMYEIIRASHPDIPYIMISRPDFAHTESDCQRRDVIIDTYRFARSQGDEMAFYIDGEGFFRGPDEDSCTVDGTHPNDLGMMKMADAIGKKLERALRGKLGS